MPRQELGTAVDMGSLMDFILFEPPADAARRCLAGSAWIKVLVELLESVAQHVAFGGFNLGDISQDRCVDQARHSLLDTHDTNMCFETHCQLLWRTTLLGCIGQRVEQVVYDAAVLNSCKVAWRHRIGFSNMHA